MLESKMEMETLRPAIYQAVMMWSDSHYERFLFRKDPGRLIEDEDKNYKFDWFKWFVIDWRVARTIKEGKLEDVRKYLDNEFRKPLETGNEGRTVDNAAQAIRDNGWSAIDSKNGNGPRSLVSKIGFFLKPKAIIPYDRFSRDGLCICTDGKFKKNGSYCDYLKAFNDLFDAVDAQIRDALMDPRVTDLAKRFRCPDEKLDLPEFRRKVLDNYLMEKGRDMGKRKKKQSG